MTETPFNQCEIIIGMLNIKNCVKTEIQNFSFLPAFFFFFFTVSVSANATIIFCLLFPPSALSSDCASYSDSEDWYHFALACIPLKWVPFQKNQALALAG